MKNLNFESTLFTIRRFRTFMRFNRERDVSFDYTLWLMRNYVKVLERYYNDFMPWVSVKEYVKQVVKPDNCFPNIVEDLCDFIAFINPQEEKSNAVS